MEEISKNFKIKFWGIRGSHPIPNPDMMKYGGNTSCVEIQVNGHLIIIDAGTGVIGLGNELIKNYISSGTNEFNREAISAVMLFSHTHHDHIQGFPFFKPAYIGTSKIHMYGSKSLGLDFIDTLSQSMFTPFFPVDLGEMDGHLFINNFRETDMIILPPGETKPFTKNIFDYDMSQLDEDCVIVHCLKSYAHPKDGVLFFKITWRGHSIVYASDKEGYVGGDSKLTAFARNADLLIHDAQYIMDDYVSPVTPKQGYGHSTPEMALEAAKLANVKKLVLFHIDPSYTDKMVDIIDENVQNSVVDAMVAYEGLELDLVCTD